MSYDSRAIANEFLDLAERQGEELTQMKLQKLVYIAHGYYLALRNKPLLNEAIEAWRFGPVIRSLYREFADFGAEPITRRAQVFDGTSLTLVEPRVDTTRDRQDAAYVKSLIARVWDAYGHLTAIQLSKLTHQDGTPWSETWKPEIPLQTIDSDCIRRHYHQLIEQR